MLGTAKPPTLCAPGSASQANANPKLQEDVSREGEVGYQEKVLPPEDAWH